MQSYAYLYYLLIASLFIDNSEIQILVLIGSSILLLLVEVISSAIEYVLDHISLEHHSLLGRTKDLGLALIFQAIFLPVITWCVIVFEYYFIS
jgi:diacylglycerol kinase (ATP)